MLKLDNTSESLDGDQAFSYFPQIRGYMEEWDSNLPPPPPRAGHPVQRVVLRGEGAGALFVGYIEYSVHTRSRFIKDVTCLLHQLFCKTWHAIRR